ncbi:MAG: hypothetical protein JKY48_08605, partial [Flavobacteriales bacterium]|nr:hypothetical protein [Flavobacteriales bacterium]
MSSLNFSELFKIIHQAWNEETKDFHLDTSLLKSAAIEKLVSNFLKSEFISLKECSEPIKQGKSVHIEVGIIPNEFLKLANCTAKIEFRLDASSIAQATLIITNKTETYYLGNSFESLQESTPGKIPFKNPEFSLRSDYDESDYAPLEKLQEQYANSTYDEEFDDRIKNGLSFKGRLSLGESWDWIVEFISGKELDCSGPIQLIGDVPRMLLKTELVENNIGPVSIPISFDQITLFAASENEEKEIDFTTSSFSRLFGLLKVKDSEMPAIPVYTIVTNNAPSYLSFRSELTAFSRYALNSFSTLLSGQDLDAWIPEGLPGTDAVALETINLDLNLSPLRVDSISAQLGILKDEKFTVIQDVMQLGNINLNFLVSEPFSENVRLDAEASGQLLLESAVISGSIDSSLALSTVKSFYFNCGLGKHSYIDVTEFVKQLVSEDLSLPAIECSTLGIKGAYDKSGTSFGFESNIESDLTIPLGLVDVTIEQLGFKFDYKKTKTDSKSLRLNGLFNLSEKAEVIVSAQYSDKGWLFEGSLDFKEDWTIQDILPAEFPIPADVLHLGIKKLSVSLNTGKKSLSLEVETDNFLSFGDLGRIENKGFTINIEKTDKGYDWDFTTKGALKLLNTSNEEDPEWMIDIAGQFSISASNSTKKFGMKFKSDAGSGSIKGIPLLIPYEFKDGGITWSEMEFRLTEIELSHKASDGWSFNANFFLKFTKLIQQIKGYLPEKGIEVQLIIDKDKAEIALKNDLLSIPIPSITLPGLGGDEPNAGVPPFETGKSLLKVGNLTLKLGKKQVGVHAEFAYYLPEHLNKLLGTEENGDPKIKIFDTYDPKQTTEGKYLGVIFEGG